MSRKKAFSRSEALLWHEETPLKRLHAGPPNRRKRAGPFIGKKGTNSDWTIVAKMLENQILGDFRHDKSLSVSDGEPDEPE